MTAPTDDEPEKVTTAQAIAMLPDGDYIHTFRNPGGMLIGSDWDRAAVVAAISSNDCELSGGMAMSMGHGLFVADERGLFVQTRDDSTATEKP